MACIRKTISFDENIRKLIEKVSKRENRTFSNMCAVLITEAIENRESKKEVNKPKTEN